MSKVVLIAGRASSYLATEIAGILGPKKADLINVDILTFSDKEFVPQITQSIRGKNVFIIQSTFEPVDNLIEAIFLGDAAMRGSAKSITFVNPYYGFGRQERKDKPRVPISAKVVAGMIEHEGHFNRVITMDLHADQIEGYFDIPVDNIYASAIFIPYIKSLNLPNLLIASPDTGGSKRANKYANWLDCEMVLCYKNREIANQVKTMTLIGDVRGKDVVLVDDIFDTGNTLIKASNLMIDNGARSVRGVITHPVMSGLSYEEIENSKFTEVVVCNTIPLQKGRPCSKIKVLTTANLFADVIWRISTNQSLSCLFLKK